MSFDLNIKNYSTSDLEKILNLSNQYSKIHIDQNVERMRENIMSDDSVDSSVKTNTIIFLNEVKEHLSSVISAGDSFIINKPQTEYTASFPSEIYPGIINPLKKRTIIQNLNIDTRFRDNYLTTPSSSFHFDLPLTLSNIVSMQLTAFEFPVELFNISEKMGNNFFSVSLNTGVSKMIILQNGLYTNTTLIDALNAFVSADPDLQILSFSTNIANQLIIQSNSVYNKFNINFNTNINNLETLGSPLPLKLGWLLGFRSSLHVNKSEYISEGSIDLTGPKYIYLVIDDYNNNVNNGFFSAFNSSILNKNILARLSVKSNIQNNLSLITADRQYFGPVDIKKMQIQLLDEFGRPIDTHHMDYSFCLTFNTIYDL